MKAFLKPSSKQANFHNFFDPGAKQSSNESKKNDEQLEKSPRGVLNDQSLRDVENDDIKNRNVQKSDAKSISNDSTPSGDEEVVVKCRKRLRRSSVLSSDEEIGTERETPRGQGAKKFRKVGSPNVEIMKSSPPKRSTKSRGAQKSDSLDHDYHDHLDDNKMDDNKMDEQDDAKGSSSSVLDLTMLAADSVWPLLQLKSNDVGERAKEKVIREMTREAKHHHEKIKKFDWNAWLLGLPISSNSLYFREYAEIISTNDIQCQAGAKQTSTSETVKSRSFPSWLMPENIRDKVGIRPDDPKYDVGTLQVPSRGSSLSKSEPKHFTPAIEQYWEIKSDHFDKIVFFKIGKFYEIFYVDAFIAQRVCGLKWMGHDDKPHVGFPEISLHSNAELLVKNGFKVVVVEQMETPKELEQRNRTAGSGSRTKSKAVKRDICEVFSIGTVLHETMLPPESQLLLSIVYSEDRTHFGFAFCDVSTCRMWVGMSGKTAGPGAGSGVGSRIESSQTLSALPSSTSQTLKSLVHQISAVEVVVDQSNVPPETMKILKLLPIPPHINIIPLNRFRDCGQFDELREMIGSGLKLQESDTLTKNQAVLEYLMSDASEALLSVVLLSRYLEAMLLKQKVLSFTRLEIFDIYGTDGTSKNGTAGNGTSGNRSDKNRLILDSTTLRHLSVLQARNGTTRGTLFEYLNQTKTAVGLRLLKRWLAAPLRNPVHINERLDSVEWFLKHDRALSQFRSDIANVPDVERLLTKVCTRGLQGLRAAVYFDDVHSKHFAEFVNLLDSLDSIQSSLMRLGQAGTEKPDFAERLAALCCLSSSVRPGVLPDISSAAAEIKNCLIQNASNLWVLKEGVDDEFDGLMSQIRDLESQLTSHLDELIDSSKSKASSSSDIPPSSWRQIQFVHTKYPYEIEVPEKHRFWKDVQKLDQTAVDVTSSRAGFVRFRTSTILDLVDQLDSLQQQLKDCLYGCQQRLFQRFYNNHYDACLFTLAALAEIDVLSSFAVIALPGVTLFGASSVPTREAMCRPHFVDCKVGSQTEQPYDSVDASIDSQSDGVLSESDSRPILRLINSRHPIVAAALPVSSGEYVPNDIRLGDPDDPAGSQTFFLVTGPNMGGKSTLLRQTCLNVIMAQIGSYVPATDCVLSPVDRIFTRIGAYDSILEGKSTFLVELEETATAVQHATIHSLVVLDELGRGTATSDGTAIAFAVGDHLANVTKCRTLFSTHFQILCDELEDSPNIRNVHMDARSDQETSTLMFMYKLVPESCPKSHGLLVARLAGINEEILKNAEKKSEEFQRASNEVHTLSKCRSLIRSLLHVIRSSNNTDPLVWDSLYERIRRLMRNSSVKSIISSSELIM